MASHERSERGGDSRPAQTAQGSSETVAVPPDAAIAAKERDVMASTSPRRSPARTEAAATQSHSDNSSSQETRAGGSATSDSTQQNSSSSSPATNGGDTTLDFAKREVSGSQGQHSFSALSSMTKRSPQQNEQEFDPGESGEPVLQANDRERIRTPASAALRQNTATDEQIGRQESFGDNNTGSSSSQESSVYRRDPVPGALSNPPSNLPSETPSVESSPKDTLGFNFAPQRRRRHYEPARVVLHKSELQPGAAANHGEGNSNRTSKTNSESELDVGTIAAAVPALAQNNRTPPASPDAAIRGSLKQLREPRQPIYIPAVLRPTDFESYKTTAGLSRIPAASRRPVTLHWVRDDQAHRCAACERTFTWYRRRHHCRKCGSVFCSTDTANTIGLDRGLNFSLLGVPCRACSSCADDFAKYCLEAPRLRDGPVVSQPPAQGGEQEEVEVAGGGDWSTF